MRASVPDAYARCGGEAPVDGGLVDVAVVHPGVTSQISESLSGMRWSKARLANHQRHIVVSVRFNELVDDDRARVPRVHSSRSTHTRTNLGQSAIAIRSVAGQDASPRAARTHLSATCCRQEAASWPHQRSPRCCHRSGMSLASELRSSPGPGLCTARAARGRMADRDDLAVVRRHDPGSEQTVEQLLHSWTPQLPGFESRKAVR